MKLEFLLLPAVLVAIAYDTYRGVADYPAFKNFTSTEDRQRILRGWVMQSFAFAGIGSLIALALMGRLPAIATPPAEFNKLSRALESTSNSPGGVNDFSFVLSMLAGVCTVAAAIALLSWLKRKRSVASGLPVAEPTIIGDVDALIPRNSAERRWAAVLSLNAGFSEELLYRLTLPLLLYSVLGDATVSMIIATLVFGLIHWYQGWKGVVGTTLLGAVLTFIYLSTGQLWVVMAVHAAIDLSSLLLRPWLLQRSRSSTAS